MKIESKFFGVAEVAEKDIIDFENGIPGFEEEKQFVFIPYENTPFSILQSVTNGNLAFITADPFVFFRDYEFTLLDNVKAALGLEKQEDIFVQVIVTLNDAIESSTANLQAPIIINKKANIGKQVVLHEENYQTKHSLGMAVTQEG